MLLPTEVFGALNRGVFVRLKNSARNCILKGSRDHVPIQTRLGCIDKIANPGPLVLQDHEPRNPPMTVMRFRNIWLRDLEPQAGSALAVAPGYKGKPFHDQFHESGPQVIPGTLQCALYDLGGEGVAYHDTDPVKQGAKLNHMEFKPEDGRSGQALQAGNTGMHLLVRTKGLIYRIPRISPISATPIWLILQKINSMSGGRKKASGPITPFV